MACLFCNKETTEAGGVHFFSADIDVSLAYCNGIIKIYSGITESSKNLNDLTNGNKEDDCLEIGVSYCPWCGEKVEKDALVEGFDFEITKENIEGENIEGNVE